MSPFVIQWRQEADDSHSDHLLMIDWESIEG
jgi:hypothetical protein